MYQLEPGSGKAVAWRGLQQGVDCLRCAGGLPPASQNVTSQAQPLRWLSLLQTYTWPGLYAAPAEYPIDVLRPRGAEAVCEIWIGFHSEMHYVAAAAL